MADLRKLPNLPALRGFDAAARHECFSRAAEEVHVTPSAISHQVRALEADLGLQLFKRHGKRIAITETGQRFAATIRKSLGEIAQAAEHLRSLNRQQRLVISVTPSFASRWLAPRLWKFIDVHPEIEVVLQSGSHLADLRLDGVDVGIRFGRGKYSGVVTEKLSDDYYYPVAAPGYRGNGGRSRKLTRPADLAHCTLLRMDTRESWQPWLTLAGLDLPEPSGTLVVEDSSLTLRHAVEGKGVALSRHTIASQEIASGTLVRLFDVALLCEEAHYLVHLPEGMEKPGVVAFRRWIFEEMQRFQAIPGWPGDVPKTPARKKAKSP
ncbi:transcriptional regulator GcvA [Herbaspirillum frisingense]|uniref:LysR family glycine cleavage system transcriptional activator n=1 Tax=Herbaspirillum frisingense TaxID=92645 RepID=A0ABU1PL83_9BURK|nr:transcriptional regulator GcvA [Herbaspirillum frisingense]MDR6586624.1 LysR family glycine cleavage system transcriptional activator [Herbaspirillum frisingense]